MQPHDPEHIEPPVHRTQDAALDQAEEPAGESRMPQDRLSRLSQAILSINQEPDPDAVLQRILEGARSLTGARHGAITVFDASGGMQDFITSGSSPERPGPLGHLNQVAGPVRLSDIASHSSPVGFPENHPPMKTFLGTPIRHHGEPLGNIHLTEREGGREFTPEDKETLAMFASQAALVITNARRYREQEQAKADLERIVNLSPVGMLIFDGKSKNLVSLNPEARRIVGSHPAPGHSLEEIVSTLTLRSPDGREMPRGNTPAARAIRGAETVRAEEIIIHLPDGQAITTVVNAAPIFSDEGEVASVVATIQDMTPLEELERLRAGFLGMVSHELRIPLATIKGFTATMLGAPSEIAQGEISQFCRIIDQQADRMRGLVNNLLDLTRIEAGMLSVTPEPTDVANVANQARDAFRMAGNRNTIDIDIPVNLPKMAADRQLIVRVLSTLFSHTARRSPEPSPISVTASQKDFQVLITVADEGRGMSPERLPHLFKKFYRADGEGAAAGMDGSGLGLALCKGIVEAHGGRIWAESDGPASGMRFTLTIPVVEDDVKVPSTSLHRLREDAQDRTRILSRWATNLRH